MAGTVVQSSGKVGFGGASTTLNLSLTGVAAGSSIIVECAGYNASAAATISANDGGAYSAINGTIGGSDSATAAILWRHNVTSGNKTIVVTTTAGGGLRYGWARAMEVTGLANAAPVTVPAASGANGATSNSPATGSSSSTATSVFVVAALAVSGGGTDAGIDSPASSGYTNHWLDNDYNVEMAGSGDYKSGAAAGVQSASWGTLTGSYPWAAALAAFEESGGGGGGDTLWSQACL